MVLFSTASFTDWNSSLRLVTPRTISLPANIAFTLIDGWLATPRMAIPSVKVRPEKPISSFNNCFPISGVRDEGNPFVLRLGMLRCAIIIPDRPALIYDWKGKSSIESSRSLLCAIVGNVLCESSDVSPCPGKCFATAITPPSSKPRA